MEKLVEGDIIVSLIDQNTNIDKCPIKKGYIGKNRYNSFKYICFEETPFGEGSYCIKNFRLAHSDEIELYNKLGPHVLKEIKLYPDSKFNVGDFVNTNDSGYQFTTMNVNSKNSTYDWKVIKRRNVRTENRTYLTVLDKVYSMYTQCWWYKLKSYNNWINEECMSLYEKESKPEVSKFKFKVGGYYVGTWNEGRCIFKTTTNSNSDKCYVIDAFNKYNAWEDGCCTGSNIIFREANADERKWLNLCIVHNTTIDNPCLDSNLTGRYLKALVDNPEFTPYKKGEYVKILRKYESSESYDVILDELGNGATVSKKDIWELMPEGFEPNKSIDKKDLWELTLEGFEPSLNEESKIIPHSSKFFYETTELKESFADMSKYLIEKPFKLNHQSPIIISSDSRIPNLIVLKQ